MNVLATGFQGIMQGLDTIMRFIAVNFERLLHLNDNIPIDNVWNQFIPQDINVILMSLWSICIVLCIIGVIKKVVLFFG